MSDKNKNSISRIEWSEPRAIGSILADIVDLDKQTIEGDTPREGWRLEDNPDLKLLADEDDALRSRLQAVEKARLDANAGRSDERASQQLFAMEQATLEYVELQGYSWQPYYSEDGQQEP